MASAGLPRSSSNLSEPRASLRSRSSVAASNTTRHQTPRSLPPWIDSYEARYGSPTEDQLRALNCPPPRAAHSHHNHSPSQPQRRVSKDGYVYEYGGMLPTDEAPRTSRARLRKLILRKDAAERGRRWDHLRSAEPVIVPRYSRASPNSPWRSYLQSSRYGHLPGEHAQIVDPEVLKELQPSFDNPIEPPRLHDSAGNRSSRNKLLYKRVWRVILQHPLVPLAFRLTVLLTSIVALALSAKIYQIETNEEETNTSERTQSIVAIVVDTVAVPYIGYMTWDEYTGKPLGLRPATQKISLVLMDLFFIIFKSASTTLAFEALVFHNSLDRQVSQYSQALAAFQTVGLISWSFTFTVNVFRLVQRLGGGEEERR
ncbi:hypothetical protein B0T21DRAFT_376275 [Apiosordaria backusii]|uniref:Regulator of phospholipase D SRF1 n=1 Tax=Apiosordaria backusii TaxID=314023 RepID=A0AA40AAE7_9PEZI|nr:hypothetical protein B0T21DRAFT_376275 [Apiosordaria backusii]